MFKKKRAPWPKGGSSHRTRVCAIVTAHRRTVLMNDGPDRRCYNVQIFLLNVNYFITVVTACTGVRALNT